VLELIFAFGGSGLPGFFDKHATTSCRAFAFYVKYSHGKYASEEAKAKREKAGLWRVQFTPPWEGRAERRGKGEITGSLPSRDCTIKGNISKKGARIYHRPGQRDYERTRITESKGERWFCSEAEARGAGWNPAKR